MRYGATLSALALGAACRGAAGAPADSALVAGKVPTLRQLATAWSGGLTRPRCQNQGPHGEYLGPMGGQYCVWTTPAEGATRGEVAAYATAAGRLTLLEWSRPAVDGADADRFSDSLGRALKARGVVARACPSGDAPAGHVELTAWEAESLSIQLSRIMPPRGAPSLTVLATDLPRAMPDVLCPQGKTK